MAGGTGGSTGLKRKNRPAQEEEHRGCAEVHRPPTGSPNQKRITSSTRLEKRLLISGGLLSQSNPARSSPAQSSPAKSSPAQSYTSSE
jgi:hypothetical protein